MKRADAFNQVEMLLQKSLNNFSDALKRHIPYNRKEDKSYSNYVPERCLTTYFAHTLLSDGFFVFNEQDYCINDKIDVECENILNKKHGKLDLLARKFSESNNINDQIQIFVEAKGNLHSCYAEIISDICRMQNFELKFTDRGDISNQKDDMFKHQFHIVLTTNWWSNELSEWWKNRDKYPKYANINKWRTGNDWPILKEKILKAKCDVVSLMESSDETLDALYAIFTKK